MLNNNCTCFSQYTMEKQYGKKQKGKFAPVLVKITQMYFLVLWSSYSTISFFLHFWIFDEDFINLNAFLFQILEPEVIVISSDDERGSGKEEHLVKRKVSKRTIEVTVEIEDIFSKKKKKKNSKWNEKMCFHCPWTNLNSLKSTVYLCMWPINLWKSFHFRNKNIQSKNNWTSNWNCLYAQKYFQYYILNVKHDSKFPKLSQFTSLGPTT